MHVREVAKAGRKVIVASHDQRVRELADRVLGWSTDGRLITTVRTASER
jgi:ABC-type lipoprotein export system ATPase subunit